MVLLDKRHHHCGVSLYLCNCVARKHCCCAPERDLPTSSEWVPNAAWQRKTRPPRASNSPPGAQSGSQITHHRLLSLCLPMLCTRAQVTSHAGSARSQCLSPPGPRIRRLFAHRTTSGCARLHKPSISSPPLSAAHHDVVGPRAVFADPCSPQVPSSSPPWPRSTTTSIWRLSGCATPSHTLRSTFLVRACLCRHLPSNGSFDALLPTLCVPSHR